MTILRRVVSALLSYPIEDGVPSVLDNADGAQAGSTPARIGFDTTGSQFAPGLFTLQPVFQAVFGRFSSWHLVL